MTYDEYEALPGIRSSSLKLMHKSPKHYRYPAQDTDTSSRKFLRAIHCATLEQKRFLTDYCFYNGNRSGKAYSSFVDAHPGVEILTRKEMDTAWEICGAVNRHPLFANADHITTECTIEWDHPTTGLRCKARLDAIIHKYGEPTIIADLKTYGSTDPRHVGRTAQNLLAHVQLAHYEEGYRLLTSSKYPFRCMLVVAENKPPYDVAVFEAERDGGAFDQGVELREKLMSRIAECELSGKWPGAVEGIQPLVLPYFDSPEEEEDIHE
jgi:hypothetical protein